MCGDREYMWEKRNRKLSCLFCRLAFNGMNGGWKMDRQSVKQTKLL